MKRGLFIIPVVTLMLAACGGKTVLDETHTFANNSWMRFEPERFQFDVNTTEKPHALILTLRYDTSRYHEAQLPLVVDFFIDSTERHNFTSAIRLRDKRGLLRGEVMGNYCTVSDTLERHRYYNREGRYTYLIKQRTSKYELFGMTGLGLRVEK